MPRIVERNLTFDFPASWSVMKYDEQYYFYTREFQHVCRDIGNPGSAAVDIVALDPASCCWLIEAKDYRQGHQTNVAALGLRVTQKVRDTLAGLATARVRATGMEKQFAEAALSCPRIRVVLHMENPPLASPLYGQSLALVNLHIYLRQRARAIDPTSQVVDIATSLHLPWTVQ